MSGEVGGGRAALEPWKTLKNAAPSRRCVWRSFVAADSQQYRVCGGRAQSSDRHSIPHTPASYRPAVIAKIDLSRVTAERALAVQSLPSHAKQNCGEHSNSGKRRPGHGHYHDLGMLAVAQTRLQDPTRRPSSTSPDCGIAGTQATGAACRGCPESPRRVRQSELH
ncbi:hypothetical protein M011DRAFT_461053 [Sporormia fimetaria CBS 119925]|uniref:Uncharacterized protein n=1 Tax=Sporormia fimetaria CBS 119925 TaxID=1340428 RepID=A0A6A6V330_9PLEO|nr:hypothetical protein M011DRAFT_461053 [Sporormia fimetaria CBS 119925]